MEDHVGCGIEHCLRRATDCNSPLKTTQRNNPKKKKKVKPSTIANKKKKDNISHPMSRCMVCIRSNTSASM
jgi:hypothetical protein